MTKETPRKDRLSHLGSENPLVGRVLKDVIEKELIRADVGMCDANTSTILITGATFMTQRSDSNKDWLGSKASTSEAIESVSLTGRDPNGQILISASYDNKDRYTTSRLAKEFGKALAAKLK